MLNNADNVFEVKSIGDIGTWLSPNSKISLSSFKSLNVCTSCHVADGGVNIDKKNIEFLRWLGVEIPNETEERLENEKTNMTTESLDISAEILKDVLKNNEKLGITVPIGLNVEHIMSYNFQYSINMLQELSKIYREFCIKTSLYDWKKNFTW